MTYRVEVEDWEKQMANKREKLKAIETTSMVLKKKVKRQTHGFYSSWYL